jgi:hypothetical protein
MGLLRLRANPEIDLKCPGGLPAYAPDDGPLTASQIAALRKDAAKHLPIGKVLARQDLFK